MRGELSPNQSEKNAWNAIRALRMVDTSCAEVQWAIDAIEDGEYDDALLFLDGFEKSPSPYCPHPVIVAIAEINNAIRYR